MNIRLSVTVCLLVLIGFTACHDEDAFSSSPNHSLTFSSDSVRLDTVFSKIPSAAKSFWVYNHSGEGVRCSNVRLERGNQTGFRVNVDGVYLGKDVGYATSEIEIRKDDSIRVYVELTAPAKHADVPQRIEDNLVFALENGKEQKVNLNAYAWDAVFLRDYHVLNDTVLSGTKPIVVFGKLTVEENKTLRIAAGTTLYFDQRAGIDVYGRLSIEGEPKKEVVLRGNRLDRMFDYLPYDALSGQWQGVHIYPSSNENAISYADIHGAYNGLMIDSAGIAGQKLLMANSTVHNCQGYGLLIRHAQVSINNSVFSNTLNDCVFIDGGDVLMNGCTLAQFYPFDSKRGVALRLSAASSPLRQFVCSNSLVTGYSDREVMRIPGKDAPRLHFAFENCLLRMPREESEDSACFKNVIYEDVKDTVRAGRKNFLLIDTDSLRYDFRLRDKSLAIGKANQATSLTLDRDGRKRDERPDIGAYEYFKP